MPHFLKLWRAVAEVDWAAMEVPNNALQTRIGSFTLNPTAAGSVSGIIVLTYDLYNADPGVNPFAQEIAGGDYVTADASVAATPVAAAPEPSSLLLLGAGLAGLAIVGAARRRLRWQ